MLLDADMTIVILKPTQQCVDWINQLPTPEDGSYSPVTLFETQNDATTLLMPKFDDEDFWPQERNFEAFLEWFEIEQHSIVYDCSDLFENNNY